ncbi:phage tail tip fiber protein [Limnobaculum xujianqingii]|uniref:phage tail tip fiber protein n=1 Tax=Limnobaculum xujianqingii TaxID=2738837 RepID=UPI0011286E1C|nr:DUF1983 domain-containing protein [Limnobaculum xujianqingii]
MPAAIPIVAAVAAGAAAAAEMYAVAAVITIASAVASMALTKKAGVNSYRDQSERKQVMRAAASPKTVVYGETETAGTLFFAEEGPGNQENGERLFMGITLAGHKLSSIGNVYLADDVIGTYGEHAEYEFHNDRSSADPYLLTNAPSWKDDMIGRGVAWLRITLKFDAEKFPSGIPNVKVLKRGWAVYDPRTGETKYSNNAALIILHFYRHYLKVPDSEILWDQFQMAANICDELVVRSDGLREPRYTINGEWDLSENKSAVLDELLASCSGDPTFIGGRHGLLVGAYYGPATEIIDEGQLAGDIEIMPEVAQRERVNTIKGTFIDPLQRFSEADFPPVRVTPWIEEDGIEISQDMKLRFVTSEYQAQRLADIKLKRTRSARTMNLSLNLSGFRYRPGMYVMVNLPTLGINMVEMRVTDWKFGIQNGVTLTLKQESAEVWNDAIGQPLERPPLTELPSGGVAQPQSLVYQVEEIGEVVQGILSWNNIGTVAYNQVVLRQNGVVVLSIQVPGSLTRLTGLIRGAYTAHVTAVNFMGARSPEAWLEFVIDAPDTPSSVRVELGYFSITLFPVLSQLTNVSTQFDFWTSWEIPLPDTSTYTVETQASRMGVGSNWSSHSLKNDHTYYWYVRSINAFGASAFIEVAALCQMDTGQLIDYLDEAIRGSGAFDNLQNGVDMNLEGQLHNALANNATAEHQWKQQGEVRADILIIKTTVADVDRGLAELSTQVQAEIGDLTSAVSEKLTAEVKSDGTASAFYTLNLGIRRDGQFHNTGFAMGIEPNGNGGYKSTTVFAADQFGIYSGNNPGNYQAAFFVNNGQVFINTAFIQDASITSAKIKDASIGSGKISNYLQSDNYVSGSVGMRLGFRDGTFEINGSTPGQGRTVSDNTGIAAYDSSGLRRVKVGKIR